MFTDKTGTLTENEMQFRECSIDGTKYREVNGKLVPEGMTDDSPDGSTPHLVTHIYTHYIHFYFGTHILYLYTVLTAAIEQAQPQHMNKSTSNVRDGFLYQAIHVINNR